MGRIGRVPPRFASIKGKQQIMKHFFVLINKINNINLRSLGDSDESDRLGYDYFVKHH